MFDHTNLKYGYKNPVREEDKRKKDIEFICELKEANLEKLLVIQKNHNHKKTPQWKKIAIQRAIERKNNARNPKIFP